MLSTVLIDPPRPLNRIVMRAFISFALMLPGLAVGQRPANMDHLLPEKAIFSESLFVDYEVAIANLLGEDAVDLGPKAVVLPSFANEFAVGLEIEEAECNVVHAEARFKLWLYSNGVLDIGDLPREDFAGFPERVNDVPVDVTKNTLDVGVCERIRTAWTEVVLRTRYPQPSESDEIVLVMDGTMYHFTAYTPQVGLISGRAHSPPSSTLPGRLVTLTIALKDYAHTDGSDGAARVEQALLTLEQAL